ncbi:MAG: YihY/virulence factor BrkB family protein [Gemmataceae bacterium]
MAFYWNLLKDAFTAWQDDRAPRMGAALAYYITFSLAPLLLIAVAVAGAVFGEQAARGEIVRDIESTVGQAGAKTIQDMLASAGTPGGSAVMIVVGVVVILLAASGIFAELQDALNTIFKAPASATTGLWHIISSRFLSFLMVLGIALILLVSLVVSTILAALSTYVTPQSMPGGFFLWHALNALISLGLVTLLFAMMYRVLPDVPLRWRDVWVGAAVTALLFTVGKTLIGLYLGRAGTTSAFGAAGSFVVILLWVYYSAQIMLFGAELTHLWSVRRGQRPDQRERTATSSEPLSRASLAGE